MTAPDITFLLIGIVIGAALAGAIMQVRQYRSRASHSAVSPMPPDARQACLNAAWWRAEIRSGRIATTNDLEWLLRDLERAGGKQ